MKKLIFLLFAAGTLLSSLSSCSNKNNDVIPSKTFVIVPGSWQGPYAWDNVKSGLEAQGNKVIVVELPAHGNDQTPPQNVSLDVYRDKVISAINSVDGQVILVGHSMGGMVISEVAEKIPAKISRLVYLGAFLPVNGQSLQDLANTDGASLLGKSLILSNDHLTLGLIQDNITNIFIQDGTAAEKTLVLQKYRVEPSIPFGDKPSLTAANFGAVAKSYIHTLQDQAVSPDLQNRMVTAAGITSIYNITGSHSPFLSKPDSVTTILLKIAK